MTCSSASEHCFYKHINKCVHRIRNKEVLNRIREKRKNVWTNLSNRKAQKIDHTLTWTSLRDILEDVVGKKKRRPRPGLEYFFLN